MKKLITLIFTITAFTQSYSQSTLRIMHYNILYYGGVHYDCNSTTNDVDMKNDALKTILAANNPEVDILSVNEMDENLYYSDYLLNNVFKYNGEWWWKRADIRGDWSINQIFYNSRKMEMSKHTSRLISPTFVDYYKMYLKTQDLEISHDTVFFTIVSAHLKAGDTDNDALTRADVVKTIMADLKTNYPVGNYLFMGDFNIYSADEVAYTYPTTYSDINYRFFDPIENEWDASLYHTQSTHTESNGCPSTGGLDDRFDIMLLSGSIMNGTAGLTYVEKSYTAFGNDGEHYNKSINEDVNNAVSQEVADALYNMSDHLPVTILLNTDKTLAVSENSAINEMFICNTPVTDKIYIKINKGNFSDKLHIQLYSVNGALAKEIVTDKNTESFEIEMQNLKNGIYFLRISDNKISEIKKIVKL